MWEAREEEVTEGVTFAFSNLLPFLFSSAVLLRQILQPFHCQSLHYFSTILPFAWSRFEEWSGGVGAGAFMGHMARLPASEACSLLPQLIMKLKSKLGEILSANHGGLFLVNVDGDALWQGNVWVGRGWSLDKCYGGFPFTKFIDMFLEIPSCLSIVIIFSLSCSLSLETQSADEVTFFFQASLGFEDQKVCEVLFEGASFLGRGALVCKGVLTFYWDRHRPHWSVL